MLATLVIFLREGVEASMIVAILLAYLSRSGQRRYFRDVFTGVAAALALAAAGGLVAYFTIHAYAGSRAQTIFETATFLLATALLTYMTFWMRSHARGLKSELQARADAVLAWHGQAAADPPSANAGTAEAAAVRAGSVAAGPAAVQGQAPGGPPSGRARPAGPDIAQAAAVTVAPMNWGTRAGLAMLAFQSVGREGVETVVFTLAIAFSSAHKGGLLAGGLIGLAIAMAIAVFMYRLGHKINVGRFFTVVGTLLMVFAAGLLVDAVQNLQELGWLPGASRQMWHTGAILSEDSALGDIAHSFFGYAQSPTVLQAVVYVLYLICVLFAFFGVRQRLARRAAMR